MNPHRQYPFAPNEIEVHRRSHKRLRRAAIAVVVAGVLFASFGAGLLLPRVLELLR